ncbi:MAG: hypothetical protein RIG62_29660 [Cyclobacteriaceae bacterium]
MPFIIPYFLLILSSLAGYSPAFSQAGYQKLTEEEIKSAPLKTAQSLADAMLTAQKKGKAYEFSEPEATPTMREENSPEKQLQTYSAIHELFGDYQSLTFVEAYQSTTKPIYRIFRFRGKFERGTPQPEVRVVLNEQAQLAGFEMRPWEDPL